MPADEWFPIIQQQGKFIVPDKRKTIPTLLQIALQYYQKGQLKEAEQYCLKICYMTSSQPDACHLLAVIYGQTRQFERANDYFEKAIAANSERADFYSNYGNALFEQGRLQDALHYCRLSLEKDHSNAGTYNIIGSILLMQNRLAEAAESFRKALAIQPKYPQALNNLGNALQKMKKPAEALIYYRSALTLQENYPEAHNNLGLGLKQLGKIDEARKQFQRAVTLRPDFIQAQQNCREVDPIWLMPLDGKRVYLRCYQEADASYLHQCYLNKSFMDLYNRYIPRYQHIDDLAKKLSQSSKKHPCQLKTVDWIIFRKSTNQPVGIANLVDIQYQHRRAEFQIGLPDPIDHARGIGLEATLLVLDYAFNYVGLNKITTIVYGHNLISQKNTLALGFVQESYLREQIIDKESGKFVDLYGNGMTLSDFRQNERLSKLSKRLLGKDIVRSANSVV